MKELNRKEAGAYLSSTRKPEASSREKRKTFLVSVKKPSLWDKIKKLGQKISPMQYAVIGLIMLNVLAYFILN